MYLSALFFCAVLVIFVPLYNIANTELLEKFKVIKRLLVDEAGEKNRTSLLIFRWITFGVFSALALITDEITVVLNLAGGIAIPIVSFYIPVDSQMTQYLLNFLYAKAYKKKMGLFWMIHDGLLLILAFIIQVVVLYYTIKVQFLGGQDDDIDF